MNHGWDESAAAWIADQGDTGDYGRRCILDAPMLARVDAFIAGRDIEKLRAIDIGCGEGRFARLLDARGINTVGLDPLAALISAATHRHPGGDYRLGSADKLPFADESFDIAVHSRTQRKGVPHAVKAEVHRIPETAQAWPNQNHPTLQIRK